MKNKRMLAVNAIVVSDHNELLLSARASSALMPALKMHLKTNEKGKLKQ